MRHTKSAALVAVLVAASLVVGCSIMPKSPGPYPTDFIPSPSASETAEALLLSPDGFDAAQRMTVRVRNVGCSSVITGTGFAVDEHTLITAGHVIVGSRRLEVSMYDGQVFQATATASTMVGDLAIVQIEESLPTIATLAEADPTVADGVTIVGYPLGGRLTTKSAVVITTAPDDVDPELGPAFAATVAVEQGMSGAPVIDEHGNVVGVVYGVSTRMPQSFFIPVSTLRLLLDQPPVMVPDVENC